MDEVFMDEIMDSMTEELESNSSSKIKESSIELWFEGYVGIDKRITVTKLPEKFSHEAWEALDQMLDDSPSPDLDIENQGFYRFNLVIESGFEDEDEFGFLIDDWSSIKANKEEL